MTYNEQVQDEIDAVHAIYPELVTELPNDRIVIKIPQHEEVSVQFSFPKNYPAVEPPHIIEVQVAQSHLEQYDVKYLEVLFADVLDQVFVKDQVCIFDFLTELDGIFEDTELAKELEQMSLNPLQGWTISDPVEDRGSTFIAFGAKVNSEDEAIKKLNILATENRLQRANHIMTAWRIKGENNVVFSDCDDDGETAAGGRMLHLITLMDGWNVVVACARWFNGGHIGPDRFKHINSTTRQVLIDGKFVDVSKAGSSNSKNSKKK
ncbi:hypothetical protein ACO0QE_003763 [Hanseniaspora vineae]